MYNLLEKYRIGVLDESDQISEWDDIENPFCNEPIRHPGVVPYGEMPSSTIDDGSTPSSAAVWAMKAAAKAAASGSLAISSLDSRHQQQSAKAESLPSALA